MTSETPKTLMVFVDGLGLGEKNPEVNPLHCGVCPTLVKLLDESKPIDARLGVRGLPQSATGQATMLTGKNASQAMGRHMEGYPNHDLREFVRAHNIFDKFTARGYSTTFANAYYLEGYSEKEKRRRRSVTTVAAHKAFGKFRDTQEMEAGNAVYQDLTRELLQAKGYEGPTIHPHEAGAHLLDIADQHDFTLFEYFQTDIAAHRGHPARVRDVLGQLDAFLKVAAQHADAKGHLFLLTSDHGNLEDSMTRTHTTHPVPLVAMGQGAEKLKAQIASLADITPALLSLYPAKP